MRCSDKVLKNQLPSASQGETLSPECMFPFSGLGFDLGRVFRRRPTLMNVNQYLWRPASEIPSRLAGGFASAWAGKSVAGKTRTIVRRNGMKLGRREFVKLTAAATAVTAFGGLGFDLAPTKAHAQLMSLRKGKETTSVCCYCSVGCGLIVTTDEATKRAINIEGDPDHPINEGALCAKGAATFQLAENPKRVTKVQYRAPNSDKWEEKSWEWALEEIAKRVKSVRDASFTGSNAKGQVVNRTEAIASCGSAAMDNEECWIYQAFLRSLGLTYIEHQARI